MLCVPLSLQWGRKLLLGLERKQWDCRKPAGAAAAAPRLQPRASGFKRRAWRYRLERPN